MIISRTPIRVSLAGGGTDLPEFYEQFTGSVTSFAIKRYVYAAANRRFDEPIRLSYSKTETVDEVNKIEHALIRESLKEFKILSTVEITTMADVPMRGTGLGSSSSLVVGLVNVLNAARGKESTPEYLAQKAFYIERNRAGEPVGSQDHYIAAYGGIRHFEFSNNGVKVETISCSLQTQRIVESWLILCHTGIARSSRSVLEEQSRITRMRIHTLMEMADQSRKIQSFLTIGNMQKLGEILNDTWFLKRSLTSITSNPEIDKIYARAMNSGTVGGKLCGAGGGGFLLFCVPPEQREKLMKSLSECKFMPVEIEPAGSTILYPPPPYVDRFPNQ